MPAKKRKVEPTKEKTSATDAESKRSKKMASKKVVSAAASAIGKTMNGSLLKSGRKYVGAHVSSAGRRANA